MAKGIYVGVGGLPRKVKKIFVGVAGVPRKVKKVFGGVAGAVKLMYSAEPQRSIAPPLSSGKSDAAGASVGNYALVSGGRDNSGRTKTVDSYNASLVKGNAPELDKAMLGQAGASIGNYALFGGGSDSSGATKYVYAYDSSLVKKTPSYELQTAGSYYASGNTTNYAFFAYGGSGYGWTTVYNSSLVRQVPTRLKNDGRLNMSCANAGGYILFAGGSDYKYVDAYDNSLVRSNPEDLNGLGFAGASVGGYALFSGGRSRSSNVVTTYDGSLVKSAAPSLSAHNIQIQGASMKEYALFAGGGLGYASDPAYVVPSVSAYDSSLVKSLLNDLSVARIKMATANVGNYTLFCGGSSDVNNKALYDTVDAYEN